MLLTCLKLELPGKKRFTRYGAVILLILHLFQEHTNEPAYAMSMQSRVRDHCPQSSFFFLLSARFVFYKVKVLTFPKFGKQAMTQNWCARHLPLLRLVHCCMRTVYRHSCEDICASEVRSQQCQQLAYALGAGLPA